MCSTIFSRILLPSLLALTLARSVSAQILDNGVDPKNLGKGDWIYVLGSATNKLGGNIEAVTNIQSLFTFYKNHGFDFIAVKAGTGGEDFPTNAPQFTAEVVNEAHTAGLKIYGYTRSCGTNVPAEINLATRVYEFGADGFIIDAEAEWEESRLGTNGPALAIELCEGIKKAFPNKFLAHSPMPIISLHRSFPFKEFGLYCDAVMPQAYWKSIGVSPTEMIEWMDEEWHAWHKSLRGSYTNAIKPLAPLGQGWSPSEEEIVTPMEIREFMTALNHDKNPVTPGGYKGVSYWRSDLHTPRMWKVMKKTEIGKPESTPVAEVELAARTGKQQEIKEKIALKAKLAAEARLAAGNGNPAADDANNFVMDDSNPNVTFIGNWYEGKNLQIKRIGTNYWCANTVTGEATATAIYRPLIRNTGEYDIYVWYIANKNRSQKVPWLISHDGGKELISVDQTKGGKWVLLASGKRFKSGTDGFISVSNDTGEEDVRVVIADAVKFVRHGGENPGAKANPQGIKPTSALANRQ